MQDRSKLAKQIEKHCKTVEKSMSDVRSAIKKWQSGPGNSPQADNVLAAAREARSGSDVIVRKMQRFSGKSEETSTLRELIDKYSLTEGTETEQEN